MPTPANLIHETSTTTGTGNLTVAAVNGKIRFSDSTYGFGTGGSDVFWYFISNQDASEWEIGTGSMSDANTLVRDTVLFSSNSDAAVSFSAGTKDVTNDVPAASQITSEDIGVRVQASWTESSVTLSGTNTTLLSGLASGVTEIEILIHDPDASSDNVYLLTRLGDSGGLEVTGYESILSSETVASQLTATDGFLTTLTASLDPNTNGVGFFANIRLVLMDSSTNLWKFSVSGFHDTTDRIEAGTGIKALSGELTQISLSAGASLTGGTAYIMYR